MKQNLQKFSQNIIEVYDDNFIYEIKRLGMYLDEYPIIGMDTEFPGMVYPCPGLSTPGFYYKYIKTNVDKLKLIQLGITLFNEKGENPTDSSTWQFNLRFNYEKDQSSAKSINLLSSCGIDFNSLKKKGIHYSTFAEYFISSGLILNENVKWVSFNGLSDFAYLLRLAINSNLPEDENEFISYLNLYFPHYYDIKILVQSSGMDILKGGLNKIAQQLGVERYGEIHQAGSDSIVTGEVMFKLISNGIFKKEEIISKKNILFGVGLGADDNETFFYTNFSSGANNNIGYGNSSLGNPGAKNSFDFDQANFYGINDGLLNQNNGNNFFDNQNTGINENMSQNAFCGNYNGNFELTQDKKFLNGVMQFNC